MPDGGRRPEPPRAMLYVDWSLGSSPMASNGGRLSGFSLQIDMNCSRKSRSYLIIVIDEQS